jgi:acetoacetyl-CoA synthetase
MAAIIDTPAEQRVPSLVLLRPGTGERPVFLVHSLTGDVLQLRAFALALQTDRPVYGVQARGLDPCQEPQTRVEDMAASYVDAIRSIQPAGPYSLGGHSFGGLVAYEMARRLTELGDRVDRLAIIDTDLHPGCLPRVARWRFRLAQPFRFLRAGLMAPRTRLPRYLRMCLRRVAPWAPIAAPAPMWSLPPLLGRLHEISMDAYARYRPGRYPGTANFFRVETREPGRCNPVPTWRSVVEGGLTVTPIPGQHVDVVAEPHVGALAASVSAYLED